MALAVKARITLIDEVVSGLSATETEGVMDLINRIRESGVSILLVEHNMKVIMGLCDRIVVLSFGTKIAEGTPAEISNNQEVQEAYLGGSSLTLESTPDAEREWPSCENVSSPAVPLM